jgi:DNA-binding response OmpR family regulator
MRGRILIIEDETELGELMSMYLSKDGFTVQVCQDAESAEVFMQKESTDLILLDINLPGKDGFEFLSEFRRSSAIPILIQSARETDEDIIMGLGIGADEFITKPVSPKVLVARVRAMLRRLRRPPAEHKLGFGDYTLDSKSGTLFLSDERIPLSSKEFEVLHYLVSHPDQAFTPEELYHEVWGKEFGDIGVVGVYIQRLRKKVEPDPANPQWFLTLRGRGYIYDSQGKFL